MIYVPIKCFIWSGISFACTFREAETATFVSLFAFLLTYIGIETLNNHCTNNAYAFLLRCQRITTTKNKHISIHVQDIQLFFSFGVVVIIVEYCFFLRRVPSFSCVRFNIPVRYLGSHWSVSLADTCVISDNKNANIPTQRNIVFTIYRVAYMRWVTHKCLDYIASPQAMSSSPSSVSYRQQWRRHHGLTIVATGTNKQMFILSLMEDTQENCALYARPMLWRKLNRITFDTEKIYRPHKNSVFHRPLGKSFCNHGWNAQILGPVIF